ncbi:hypothetical protein GWD52_13950 [Enterobacteriaceae bacterium 4M9]|nr:hypothetical protein [Enterobacteriaceae bacterium 4M9]
MTVNSAGEQNRVATRDFNESRIQIDRFDGRHTINIGVPDEKEDKRPMVWAQRNEIHNLVNSIAGDDDSAKRELWTKLNAEVGVNSFKDMTINQYQTAISFLQAMLDRNKEHDASKTLVGLLLRNSEDSEIRKKLIRHCHINFGTGRLNDLDRSQLQLALSWLDQQSLYPASALKLNTKALIRAYPKQIAITFILGFVLGVIIF